MKKVEIDEIAGMLSKHPNTTTCPLPVSITKQKEKMDEVNALLRLTAKRKGCKVSDLEWKRGRKFGEIHIRMKKKNENP